MKKGFQQSKLFKSFVVLMAVVLLFGSLPITTLANEQKEDKEVLQLAKDLEFLMEEAAIYDSNDILLGFDFKKLENRFGNVEEFDELKQEIENDNNKECSSEIQNPFG